jgi:hypothetical protein
MFTNYKKKEIDEFNKISLADIAAYRLEKGMPMLDGYKIKSA